MFETIYKLLNWWILEYKDVKDFDLYTNITLNEQTNNRYKFPGCFIEFLPVQIDQMLENLDVCQISFNLHFIFDNLVGTSIETLSLIDGVSAHINKLNRLTFVDTPVDIRNENISVWSFLRKQANINPRKINNSLSEVVLNYKVNVVDATGTEKSDYWFKIASLDDIHLEKEIKNYIY